MSQNDFTIANQTFPNFRSDLNDALQALASLSSGSSAPSTTYPNMLWYDTGNNILKMRTEADDAWIDLGVLDQNQNVFNPSNAVPVASVISIASNNVPDGWLECNGASVSRTVYSKLFNSIGTTFGSGDGSTTFNLPDLRGEFVRGWDDGRGVDSGRAFGSAQADEIKSHSHTQTVSGRDNGATGFDGDYPSSNRNPISSRLSPYQTDTTGGTETRPRNVALLYCIKY